ncbi:MAG TPA: cbb3-type cytochrome oxidase assembly protein CcoS [Pseudolabrys sp.]|jgi:cbb3-type cytochrome oxidase maturation protein|uniref:cbb3-type cytochrome oxidase assembly protein CcoS n=1 Tax=Pseudolabrys sp. TaxID=1960880 RepID=UPI002DDD576C|nr:cbb3-type cytochrome oxidase assembly protein CcoS [Pseudolabrys sp.]HEV2629543.1 cbb3-type cytochrome oxidase assembly protein CcoS [Pseudolabrys sp.]
MNVLIYLVPLALGLGLIGLFGFLWALRSGQYGDVDGAALRILQDDDVETK